MSTFPHIYSRKKNKLTLPPWLKGVPSAPRPGAFTLIELLIAVSIFSITSIAIYSTFNSGASVLRRVKNIDFVRQRTLLKIEKFSRELREQPSYKKLLFSGTQSKIIFPGTIDYAPCRLTYYFDNSTSSFMRAADKLSQIITPEGNLDPELKSKPMVFLSNIKDVKIEYLYLDLKKNEYNWALEWTQNFLPLAVRFTITNGSQKYVSTVFLPKTS